MLLDVEVNGSGAAIFESFYRASQLSSDLVCIMGLADSHFLQTMAVRTHSDMDVGRTSSGLLSTWLSNDFKLQAR